MANISTYIDKLINREPDNNITFSLNIPQWQQSYYNLYDKYINYNNKNYYDDLYFPRKTYLIASRLFLVMMAEDGWHDEVLDFIEDTLIRNNDEYECNIENMEVDNPTINGRTYPGRIDYDNYNNLEYPINRLLYHKLNHQITYLTITNINDRVWIICHLHEENPDYYNYNYGIFFHYPLSHEEYYHIEYNRGLENWLWENVPSLSNNVKIINRPIENTYASTYVRQESYIDDYNSRVLCAEPVYIDTIDIKIDDRFYKIPYYPHKYYYSDYSDSQSQPELINYYNGN